MPLRILSVLAILVTGSGQVHADQIADLTGDWRTVRHAAIVSIQDCGDGMPCGYLASVNPDITQGSTRDENNNDSKLRDRSLEGLPILWGYAPNAKGWTGGRLYNPETGQTFRSSLKLLSKDRLQVKGCMGPLCRAQVWTRVDSSSFQHFKDQNND